MKRITVLYSIYGIVFLFLASAFLSNIVFTRIYAKEEYHPKYYKYYTSIEIQSGDTLWSIARRYANEEFISVPDYVDQLKYINHLTSDKIIEGHYLTIMYYSELYK